MTTDESKEIAYKVALVVGGVAIGSYIYYKWKNGECPIPFMCKAEPKALESEKEKEAKGLETGDDASASKYIIKDVDQFDDVISAALGEGKQIVIYCYGDNKEGTNESWCGDCVSADPIIRRIAKEEDGTLVEIAVGDRDSYKVSPNNQWKEFEKTKLTAIPTLIRWGIGGAKKTLVEGECMDEDKVRELFSRGSK